MYKHKGEIKHREEVHEPNEGKKEKKSRKIETEGTLLLNAKNLNGNNLFTEEQVYELLELSLKNGTKIFTLDNRSFIYDFIGYIFLKKENEINKIINEMKILAEENLITSYDLFFKLDLFKKAEIKYFSEL